MFNDDRVTRACTSTLQKAVGGTLRIHSRRSVKGANMKGLFTIILVIVAVTAVRSQGPPTKTRKGTRPARRNDNPDVGLPSGADVPDGRRLPPTGVRRGPPPPAYRVRPAARASSRVPPARGGAPPKVTRTRSGKRPAGRRNDNPDFGLPSGRDYPDAGLRPRAPYVAPPPARQPAVPVLTCEMLCRNAGYKTVCGINGQDYMNDCLRECDGVPQACENPCPCNQPVAAPTYNTYADPCDHCFAEGYDPVCVDDEKEMFNECEALCKGKTITCSSSCPC